MEHRQFELDGYLFGGDTAPVRVERFEPGVRVVQTQDGQRPGQPGRTFGRDHDDGPEWVFELGVHGATGLEVLEVLEDLRGAWQAAEVVSTPGALSTLRFSRYGIPRRVYGRPRRFAAPEVFLWEDLRYLPITAAFQLEDPLIYDDAAVVLDLPLVSTPEGVLTLPAELPWVLGGRAGQRAGEVVVGGRAPVPFELTFHGPASGSASGFWAQGAGWRIDLAAPLAWDQSVTVDTRTSTVLRNDGRSLAGDARGRFLTARLQPGAQEVRWGCNDPTATASMTLTHRPGYYSI